MAVVIVSEETGNISIAHRGLLTRNLTEESVKDLLCELLVEERERKAPAQFRNIFGRREK